MSGGQGWKWSKQTIVMPTQTVHEGKVEEFLIATIPPTPMDNLFMDIFGDRVDLPR
jgi:hypothetical protein